MTRHERHDRDDDRVEERDDSPARLMVPEDEASFRERWTSIQTGFVDEPRRAVQDADALVMEATKRLTDVFTRERSKLEEQWTRREEVSTEDLRMVLRRYRSFFDRLLGLRAPAPRQPERTPPRPERGGDVRSTVAE